MPPDFVRKSRRKDGTNIEECLNNALGNADSKRTVSVAREDGDGFENVEMSNKEIFMQLLYHEKNICRKMYCCNHFNDVMELDPIHKRLAANLATGDFISGNYNTQLNEDFLNLCKYLERINI